MDNEIQLEMSSYDWKPKQHKRTLLKRIRANRYRDKLADGVRDKKSLKVLKERWFLGERILKIKWTKVEEVDISPTWDKPTVEEINRYRQEYCGWFKE